MSLSEFATPRSALRDINEGNNPLRNLKPLKSTNPSANSFKKPSCPLQPSFGLQNSTKKKHLNIHVDVDPKQTVKPIKATITVNEPELFPEIELMHSYNPELDFTVKRDPDFCGVAEKLRNWRPPCLFGWRPDSDLDDSSGDEEITKHISIPILPEPPFIDPFMDESLKEHFDFELPEPNIDIPVPHLNDSFWDEILR